MWISDHYLQIFKPKFDYLMFILIREKWLLRQHLEVPDKKIDILIAAATVITSGAVMTTNNNSKILKTHTITGQK